MNPRRYFGKLYYEDGEEYLDVLAFIIRENDIGFSVASVTIEHGRWEAETGKPAILQPDGSYLSKQVLAKKSNVIASCPWDIVFQVNYEDHGSFVEVSGELIEAGIRYQFEGELKGA